ncbi:cilia- and flagella-associated protein 97 [Pempheris klunzingeri]|uniref:cilia- and flagella-associated protein 97 n=1 Tax=Pempheris klunzingeri TaxID=3127111 RepID=UPI00397F8087
MFNPSELEGEVDHSFFDSDCDDTSVGRDGGKKTEKGLKAEKESPPARESLNAKQSKNTKGGRSLRSDGTKKYLKPVENNSSSKAERKENSCQSKEDQWSRSSLPSVAYTSDKVTNYSSDSEEDSNLPLKRPNGTLMALLAEAREADYKDAYRSPNETEEEALPSNTTDSKGRNKQSPKKLIRNRRTRSPSPTSTEASVEADSESCCSSSSGRSDSESPTLPRPNKSSLSPGVRRIRVGSAGSRDVPASRTEESEDTVTDVSPLSSPDSSPLQSLDLSHTEAGEGSLKEQQQRESVPSSGLSSTHQDEDSDQDVDDSSLSSESQLGGRLVFHCPRRRKNYSFTNDEVRCIDRENQRLLQQLSRLSPSPRPGSTARKKTHIANNPPLTRLSHSALNRQREQQRIERENLAFLKRLESVKPTPGLKRSQQLTDYQRQVGYLGGPSYSICVSSAQKERSTSKTPTGPSRTVSSACHSPRAASTNSESRNSPAQRSKKLSAARPAWC